MYTSTSRRDEFLKLTECLGDMEKLYKRLYELRNDPMAEIAFLNKQRTGSSVLDQERVEKMIREGDIAGVKLRENDLSLFLDLIHSGALSSMDETGYVFSASADIAMSKHGCYTPRFEHSHTFFELVYVYRGSCRNTIGNEVIDMEEGDFCFITPGQKHMLEEYSDGIIINVMIRKSTFMKSLFFPMNDSNILSQFFYHALMDEDGSRFLLFRTGQDEFIKSAMEYMYMENHSHGAYYSQILNSAVINLFFYLLREHVQTVRTDGTQESGTTIIAILSYIQNHYQDLSLESTAQHFHYNPSYLGKLLKRNTGKNFVQLVRDCRMERACQLLADSEYTIGAISAMVGYENMEHFNRTFRKTYHIAPSAWRKAHRE